MLFEMCISLCLTCASHAVWNVIIHFIKYKLLSHKIICFLKSASNLNGNLNCSKELEHYAS